ncbi:hypothetical protein D9M70_444830 [compost metagenome]
MPDEDVLEQPEVAFAEGVLADAQRWLHRGWGNGQGGFVGDEVQAALDLLAGEGRQTHPVETALEGRVATFFLFEVEARIGGGDACGTGAEVADQRQLAGAGQEAGFFLAESAGGRLLAHGPEIGAWKHRLDDRADLVVGGEVGNRR